MFKIFIPDDELIIVKAKKDFKTNGYDVKEGELFNASEKEGVIVNGSFACTIGSPTFEAWFEIIN
ncbi:hypothetical protein SporoP37_04990 [Sporosarcina sp. P37]|uniref:hypothetical protein n=1 Tax=unclassified Sporosarcina TaxID=2647733 RepID=UPI0009BC8DE8|nr:MULTISPECIES: hypothetical protein [unclassified Sporosarcina]ARD47517.1 hypothetical protein SporoP33_04205 [Sporosarcina sp. P33]ARK24100.1 hypothetical protein SporoP37_04990 [Sporosarcina sp. P37]PID18507.1 hypothetical protein CSV62_07590 [Sporosarcina sp. P35]